MTEEQKEKNLKLYFESLEKYGVDVSRLRDEFGELIKNAPMALKNDTPLGTEGMMVSFVLRDVTPTALKLLEVLGDTEIEKASVIKVCCLMHLAKATTIVPNDMEWEIQKMGKVFKYVEMNNSLQNGVRALMMASNMGITFTDCEAEAMTILDRSDDDMSMKYHASSLATIVKAANELMFAKYRMLSKPQ